jgi:3'(2'), 5'-bisphosphate nucleotidase
MLMAAMRLAVAEASHLCREVRRRDGDPAGLTKSDDSPVTVADFAAQAVVLHRMTAALGPLWVVAEESTAALRQAPALRDKVVDAVRIVWPDAQPDDVLGAIDLGRAEPPVSGPWWALDPIDGTKGFVRGGQFAVCLGRIEDGGPTYSALGCPHLAADPSVPATEVDRTGALFLTDGQTVTVEAIDGGTAVVLAPVLEASTPAVVVRSYESGHTRIDDIRRVMDGAKLPFHEVAVDSQVKYALVASGRADVYLRLPHDPNRRDPVWDHAAGVSMVTALQRRATDVRGAELDWTAGATLANNTGILCAPASIHGRLVRSAGA